LNGGVHTEGAEKKSISEERTHLVVQLKKLATLRD